VLEKSPKIGARAGVAIKSGSWQGPGILRESSDRVRSGFLSGNVFFKIRITGTAMTYAYYALCAVPAICLTMLSSMSRGWSDSEVKISLFVAVAVSSPALTVLGLLLAGMKPRVRSGLLIAAAVALLPGVILFLEWKASV
jgi:hypothetical protein